MKNSLLLVLIFALFPAQGYSENLDGQALAKNLYRLILKGDSKSILSAFDNAPNIDTPRTGAIRGRKNLVQFIASENNWLREHGIVENSLAEVRTTISEDRIIYEQRLTLEKTSPMKHHRFAVVVDLKGKQADSVRIYYALNDITGRNDFSRPSMLENDPALFEGVAAPAKQYLSSIDNAYRDVYRMFVDDACFSALCGKTKIAKFFVVGMHAGSVPLKLTTATCDGSACALEWNLASWGEVNFSVNVGGLALFEFNNQGLLTAVRIYNDIHDVPFSSQLGWFADNWEALAQSYEAIGCPMEKSPGSKDNSDMAWNIIMGQACIGE